jgi:hypothetical protein
MLPAGVYVVKKSFLFALVGLTAVAGSAFAQDGAVIRRELKEGATDTYKVEVSYKQKVYTEQMGEQDFNVVGNMLYAEKIGKFDPEKKLSALDVTISKMRFELTGLAQMLQTQIDALPKEVKYQGKVSDRNQVSGMKIDPASAQFAGLLSLLGGGWSAFSVLPEQAVKIGDAWDYVVPKLAPFGNKEFTLKAKLTGEKTVGTAQAYVITLDGVLPMDMDMSSLTGAGGGGESDGQSARLVGPLDFHMEAVIEKATGRLLEMKATNKGKQNLEMSGAGVSIEVNGETTTKMTWVAPEPVKAAG